MIKESGEILFDRFVSGQKVSTDTRELVPGQMFIALKGPNFDGNKYADQALDLGASTVVVDDPIVFKANDPRYVLASNGLAALQKLAADWRRSLDIPVIGIAGSNGKTTTKELVQRVLSGHYKAFSSPGNLNNHIGVPLSLLQIDIADEIAVIEMGANHRGEIAALCQIAMPNYGLITNVGKDHLEGFGGVEGSMKANAELFDYLGTNNGRIFLNTEDLTVSKMAEGFKHPITFPAEEDFYTCKYIQASPFVTFSDEQGARIETRLSGAYNFSNLAAALCVGKFFEVPTRSSIKAVSEYVPTNNRSQWIQTQENSVLLDAYNANPSSMEVALESFSHIRDGRKMVILGDMFELGTFSAEEHKKLGQSLNDRDLVEILLCGTEMRHAAGECPGATYFVEKHSLIEHLSKYPPKGNIILIKGSRRMALEDCLDFL